MQKLQSFAFLYALFGVTLALAACGSADRAPVHSKVPEGIRDFSDDDKRAAISLSIGNVQALSSKTSAYDRSLACSIALENVHARLSASGQLDTAIINTINQVSKDYDSQIQQLGAAKSKSSAEIAADRLQRAEEIAMQSEHGQIAIGCLRAMS